MVRPITIVWFRRDLRLADHPALDAACRRGGPVIPLFLWPFAEAEPLPWGKASQWWLSQSLLRLQEALGTLGSQLIFRQGPAFPALRTLAQECHADAIYWNRSYEPSAVHAEEEIATQLRDFGLEVQTFQASLLYDPETILTHEKTPYKVFSSFFTACQKHPSPRDPLPAPRSIPAPRKWPRSYPIESLPFFAARTLESYGRFWKPGEVAAHDLLAPFLSVLEHYPQDRDRIATMGTSRLSPYLHFGEISPFQVWHTIRKAAETRGCEEAATIFHRQLLWREFASATLYHNPSLPQQPLQPRFRSFRWRHDPEGLLAWKKGRTGYPLVDAAMRQLATMGWIPNRARMVVASFLVKDLLIPWQEGAAWFWDHLLDADLANNAFGWQWCAGCGVDPVPYVRIFHPVRQGERFDPDGTYIREWVPELAALPSRWIHRPWEAPAEVLHQAGVTIGSTYPAPIVDHAKARERALLAFRRLPLAPFR